MLVVFVSVAPHHASLCEDLSQGVNVQPELAGFQALAPLNTRTVGESLMA